MGHTSSVISKPTDVYGDIGSFFGIASGDVGYLVNNAPINKWAKYKPVPLSTVGLTGKTSGNTYWKGRDGKCGLNIQEFSEFGNPGTSSAFAYKLLNNQLPWDYVRPNGGNNPYRVLDFDGYDHTCVPFMEPLLVTNYMIHSDGTLQIDYDFVDIQSNDNLKLADIDIQNTSLSNWYFGILVYYNSSTFEYYTAQSVISQGVLSVTFSGMGSYVGKTVKVVPFLSSIRMTTQSTAVVGGYYTSFNLPAQDCTLVASSAGIDVIFAEALWNGAGTSLSYQINLDNTNAGSFTVQNIHIALWENSATTGTQIASRDISSLTIAGGSTSAITGTFSATMDQSKMYFLSINTAGNNVIPFDYTETEWDQPMEE